MPDWEQLRGAKVWLNPSAGAAAFIQSLKVPMRQFREIETDTTDVVMVEVGEQFFMAYRLEMANGAALIPAVAAEHPVSGVVMLVDKMSGMPPPQVLKAVEEGWPCLMWGEHNKVTEMTQQMMTVMPGGQIVEYIQLMIKKKDHTWRRDLLAVIATHNVKRKVCPNAPRRACFN